METFLVWLRGLFAAFIQGGASAVTATVTASMIAPDKFNLSNQVGNFFTLAGTTFVISGALGAMAYLKQSPLPVIPDQTQSVTITATQTGIKPQEGAIQPTIKPAP